MGTSIGGGKRPTLKHFKGDERFMREAVELAAEYYYKVPENGLAHVIAAALEKAHASGQREGRCNMCGPADVKYPKLDNLNVLETRKRLVEAGHFDPAAYADAKTHVGEMFEQVADTAYSAMRYKAWIDDPDTGDTELAEDQLSLIRYEKKLDELAQQLIPEAKAAGVELPPEWVALFP